MTALSSADPPTEHAAVWIEVCRSTDVTADEPKAVQVGTNEIGLFRVGGELFAIDNICSHEYAYLTKGLLEGDVIECPLHEAKFCVRTGACLQGPAVSPVAVFQTREEAGAVFVMVTDV
jgi:3-phenylpropionate/trans-cinnamate dioxygenase ferredoxin subunit